MISTVPKGSTALQCDAMLRRLRRRTMAPSRPLLYPDQIGLALFSVLAIVAGVYAVVRLFA